MSRIGTVYAIVNVRTNQIMTNDRRWVDSAIPGKEPGDIFSLKGSPKQRQTLIDQMNFICPENDPQFKMIQIDSSQSFKRDKAMVLQVA